MNKEARTNFILNDTNVKHLYEVIICLEALNIYIVQLDQSSVKSQKARNDLQSGMKQGTYTYYRFRSAQPVVQASNFKFTI